MPFAIHPPPEAAIVHAINRAREERRLPRLAPSRRLERVAVRQSHNVLRADSLSHDAGGSLARRTRGLGLVGETLAWAPRGAGVGARRVVRMWLQSPGHRAILLDRRFRRVGVGREYGALGRVRGDAVTAAFAR